MFLADGSFETGELAQINVLMWKSSRQKRVARSTFGAETLALGDLVDMADFARAMFAEVRGEKDLKTVLDRRPGVH